MGPSSTENAAPVAAAPVATVPSRVAPQRPAGAGRGLVIGGTALAACAVVVAGIVLTNDALQSAADKRAQTAGAVTIDVSDPAAGKPIEAPPLPKEVIDKEVQTILQKVEQLDKTVWKDEVKAQEYEEYFIDVWDKVRAAKDKWGVLLEARFDTLTYGKPAKTETHDWGVTVTKFDGADNSVDPKAWREMIAGLITAGYQLTEIEFHQSNFTHKAGEPARSEVATVLHLVNGKLNSRTAIRTKLKVEWSDKVDKAGPVPIYLARAIEASDIVAADRVGGVTFQEVALPGGGKRGYQVDESTQSLLVYDLDNDGRSELVIPGENTILRNKGNFKFEREELLRGMAPGKNRLSAGVVGDFDGDGLADLLCAKGTEMFLIRGEANGRFSAAPPERAVTLAFPIRGISTLTAGDVDGDGDLDAWFGQYKAMYDQGNMPTPYYDANDGNPGALLINDGAGRFVDATETAGLAAKRFRRTLAGSLVDLDGDRDLDLLVNSDFAGLDIYYNDGKGNYADVTDRVIDERHNFGMGHTFADFNVDGRVDMYTIGMSSTTARRLTAMGAGLEERPDIQAKRPQMGYGNRMFFAPPPVEPGAAPAMFRQPTFKDDVARTGWSWGVSAPDFDNDGDPDIFVANGHLSGQTCRDYCTTYWRRDVYLGSSRENAVYKQLWDKHGMTPNVSWNGFEHDVLFMNEGGKSFLNVAHLMGVAFEADTRGVISEDFDGDGLMDLVIAEQVSWNKTRFIHVYKSTWPTKLNWIGVRLAGSRPGRSPLGAEVRVDTARGVQPARIVTGDSYVAQHAAAKHFGLGTLDKVEAFEVIWPNGQTTRVEDPAINTWHMVDAAGGAGAATATTAAR